MEKGSTVEEILILLVDADAANSACLSNVLLEFNYGVVTANCGEEALSVLQQKLHGIQLVLVTNTKLPDMCPFEFIEIVERECRLPVVLICDTYDETTTLRGLSCGAVLVLAKPLSFHDIENLWRQCLMKDRQVKVDSLDLRVKSVERDSCESSVTSALEKNPVLHESGCISNGHKKRKIHSGALASTLELPPVSLPAAPPTIAAEGFRAPSGSATAPMLWQQGEDEIENMELTMTDSNGAI